MRLAYLVLNRREYLAGHLYQIYMNSNPRLEAHCRFAPIEGNCMHGRWCIFLSTTMRKLMNDIYPHLKHRHHEPVYHQLLHLSQHHLPRFLSAFCKFVLNGLLDGPTGGCRRFRLEDVGPLLERPKLRLWELRVLRSLHQHLRFPGIYSAETSAAGSEMRVRGTLLGVLALFELVVDCRLGTFEAACCSRFRLVEQPAKHRAASIHHFGLP